MKALVRLKQARIAAGFTSARAAALAMGVPPATYVQHENGTRGLSVWKMETYETFFAKQREEADEKPS